MNEQARTNRMQPVAQARLGRLQISVWRRKHTRTGTRTTMLQQDRVCLQQSRWHRATDTWTRKCLWMSPDELRDLVQLLDKFSEELWRST